MPPYKITGDALPCTVVALAGNLAGGGDTDAIEAHKALFKDNYVIEGLAMAPWLFPRFDHGAKAINVIEDTLRRGQKALAELPPEFFSEDALPLPLAPAQLLDAIAAVRKVKRWDPLTAIAKHIYPVNLLLAEPAHP
ncbi:MAG: hypothetical protein KAX55_04590 [Propionivibrio sp.]|jgi:hypothetical protein|nr:hypothetical protein [Propionivibrio sp.]